MAIDIDVLTAAPDSVAGGVTSRTMRVLALLIAATSSIVAVEAVCRVIDNFQLASVFLRPREQDPLVSVAGKPDSPYVSAVRLADSVRPEWYAGRPRPIPRIKLSTELKGRADRYGADPDRYSAFFEWNRKFLEDQACRSAADRAVTLGRVTDFYYFDSTDGSQFPIYRHLRHISPPYWFVTNSFGWRGPDVALNKPSNTIRIAFIGASTTIDAYGLPFSHPELVGHWLNQWGEAGHLPYRFEVINAGRTGIDTQSIAAIVRQELVPLEPDIVVFYEGANQFWPGSMIQVDDPSQKLEKPRATYRNRTAAEDYSALMRRAIQLVTRVRAGNGSEPVKPHSVINWPAGVDELDPPLDQRLPMNLPTVVRDLETIREALAGIRADLVISSFIWMVWDGMKLDVNRDFSLYDYLNRSYWPVTYAQMRRLADFQNRVFEKYASSYRLPFIDMAGEYPRDPALAGDAVHLRYTGLVLQGWIFLQHLIPIIQQRLAEGRLPKPQQVVRTIHPAFAQDGGRLITLEALQKNCHQ